MTAPARLPVDKYTGPTIRVGVSSGFALLPYTVEAIARKGGRGSVWILDGHVDKKPRLIRLRYEGASDRSVHFYDREGAKVGQYPSQHRLVILVSR